MENTLGTIKNFQKGLSAFAVGDTLRYVIRIDVWSPTNFQLSLEKMKID